MQYQYYERTWLSPVGIFCVIVHFRYVNNWFAIQNSFFLENRWRSYPYDRDNHIQYNVLCKKQSQQLVYFSFLIKIQWYMYNWYTKLKTSDLENWWRSYPYKRGILWLTVIFLPNGKLVKIINKKDKRACALLL